MAVVHGSRHPAGFFRPREVAWGLATGFAGAALGLMLSMIGPTLETVVTTDSQQNYSTAVSDDFDQLAVELASSK